MQARNTYAPDAVVIDLATYRLGRFAIMQEAERSTELIEQEEVVEERRTEVSADAAVNSWVQRVMLGAVSILITILLAFFAWSVPTIQSIHTSTQLLAADQSYTKAEISRLGESYAGLRTGLDQLTLQSGKWATTDQVLVTRDQLTEKITSIEAQLNDLKLRVALIEQPKAHAR